VKRIRIESDEGKHLCTLVPVGENYLVYMAADASVPEAILTYDEDWALYELGDLDTPAETGIDLLAVTEEWISGRWTGA